MRSIIVQTLKVVLGYIADDAKKFHVYVANCVHAIRQQTKLNQWLHIPGNLNPVDIASRGLACHELNGFNGQHFLNNQTYSSG